MQLYRAAAAVGNARRGEFFAPADTGGARSEASAPPGTQAPQMKLAYSLTTASPPRGNLAGMPATKMFLGLVLRAAAVLAGIMMRLFGIA